MVSFFRHLAKVRLIALSFILLCVALFVLAACSNSGSPIGGSSSSAATATPKAAPTDTPPAATATPMETQGMTETAVTTTTQGMTETSMTTPTQAMTETSTTTVTEQMTETTSMTEPLVMLHEDAKLGKILVDAKGMTLYVFDKDELGKSNCSGQCLQNWPPLTVASEDATLTAGEGITGKLGVIEGTDGSYQVTINEMPLYYYAKDTKAGDTTGQAVGEIWWVVGADGAKVTTK